MFKCKYKIVLIFLIIILCFVSLSCVSADSNESQVNNQNHDLFIEYIENNNVSVSENNIIKGNIASSDDFYNSSSEELVSSRTESNINNSYGLEHIPPSCDSLDDGEPLLNQNSSLNEGLLVSMDDEISNSILDVPVNSIILGDIPATSVSFNDNSGLKIRTSLIGYDFTQDYGDNGSFKVQLLDSMSNPLSGKTIFFRLVAPNGNYEIYSDVTDNWGNAHLLINLIPLILGVQTIYIGDSDYAGVYIINNLIINKANSYLSSRNFVFNHKGCYYQVKLFDKFNNPIVGVTVSMDLRNGDVHKIYYDTTNSNGIARLQINLNPYNFTIHSNYGGGSDYNSATECVNSLEMRDSSVKLSSSLILVNNIINHEGDNLSFRLVDNNGVNLVGETINFVLIRGSHVPGPSYTAITDENGLANLEINLVPSNWRFNVYYSGSNYYGYYGLYQEINQLIVSLNLTGGYYSASNLSINLSAYNSTYSIFYSFDGGVSWKNSTSDISFLLTEGNWTIKYYGVFWRVGETYTSNFIIDNTSPLVWADYSSGVHSKSFNVKLSAFDEGDSNPKIYYTLDGSCPSENSLVYSHPIYIGSTTTTTLRFAAMDKAGYKSNISSLHYIFAAVGNLNTGKAYAHIQDAIDDNATLNNHVIEVRE